jgi:hypothetical protein
MAPRQHILWATERTPMTRLAFSRRLFTALALGLLLIPACVAAAKTESHKPKTESHRRKTERRKRRTERHKPSCRAGYVARRVRVRKRRHHRLGRHHRLVWVRRWKCVKAKRNPAPVPPPRAGEGPVTNPPQPPSTDCAGAPGSGTPNYASLDACGFPSPDTTGVPAGARLNPSGSITAGTPGEVINGLAVNGTIDVTASNVTIENTDVANASSCCWGVRIEPGVTGTLLKYDTIHGTDNGSGSLAWAVDNAGDINSVTEDHVYMYDADRILNGPGTLTNSYCLDNANISGEHYECVYTGEGSVIINHDTLLNTHSQTGATWVGPDFGNIDTYTVENSLLAGGGYTLYGAATNSSNPARGALVGPVTIQNNRFSRLYFSQGGYWGPALYFDLSKTTWSGNVWDDTNRPVSP